MENKEIVNQLIDYYCGGHKAKFAEMLGVKPQTISSWISRNKFDISLVSAKCVEISKEWLLTGNGNMLKSEQDVQTKNTKIDAASLADMVRRSQLQIDETQRQIKKSQEQLDMLFRLITTNNQ